MIALLTDDEKSGRALVPTLDHLADADESYEGLIPTVQVSDACAVTRRARWARYTPVPTRVELLSIREGTHVVDLDRVCDNDGVGIEASCAKDEEKYAPPLFGKFWPSPG